MRIFQEKIYKTSNITEKVNFICSWVTREINLKNIQEVDFPECSGGILGVKDSGCYLRTMFWKYRS